MTELLVLRESLLLHCLRCRFGFEATTSVEVLQAELIFSRLLLLLILILVVAPSLIAIRIIVLPVLVIPVSILVLVPLRLLLLLVVIRHDTNLGLRVCGIG